VRIILILLAFVGVSPSIGSAEEDPDYNKIGQKAYALWDCASYAALAGTDEVSGIQFFDKGHELMGVFVEAAMDGKLSEANANRVPIGVRWWLISGPSVEFSLGYMWAQFTEQASNNTFDADSLGDYDTKRDLQKSMARTKLREKNCALLLE
jgi:hypothetical protein